ncbi:hypothetical protein BU17DRAFT_67383 [Hysterangium stoloniferum]|nr:hypothetical protein BU17DRAFT_67383 [Hysterangium stoloniferum]
MIYSAIHTPPNAIFLATSNPALLSQITLQSIDEFSSRDDDILEMCAIAASGSRKQENSQTSLNRERQSVAPSITFEIFMGLDADDQEGSASYTFRALFETITEASSAAVDFCYEPTASVVKRSSPIAYEKFPSRSPASKSMNISGMPRARDWTRMKIVLGGDIDDWHWFGKRCNGRE